MSGNELLCRLDAVPDQRVDCSSTVRSRGRGHDSSELADEAILPRTNPAGQFRTIIDPTRGAVIQERKKLDPDSNCGLCPFRVRKSGKEQDTHDLLYRDDPI